MCKIFMIAGIKKEHQEKAERLLKEAAKVISVIDNDGLGYAAITESGRIYGEKWLNNSDAFTFHKQPEPSEAEVKMQALFGKAAKFKVSIVSGKVYDNFGDDSDKENVVAYILHARKKTIGEKSTENTHPFYMAPSNDHPGTALIHNGSIVNHTTLTKTMSTCDSEVILHEYLKNYTYHNPNGIQDIARALVGEYAVGVLSSQQFTDDTVIPILDVFKSNKELYSCYIPELETFVLSTADYHLKNMIEACGMTMQHQCEIEDGLLIRINAITGERIEELIEFDLSKKWETTTHTSYPYRPSNVTVLPKEESIEEKKKSFESKHPTLFDSRYYNVEKKLTTLENTLLTELNATTSLDFQALKLTNKLLNIAQ